MNDKAVSSPSHHSSVGFHLTARAEEQQCISPLTHTGHSSYLDLFRWLKPRSCTHSCKGPTLL